MGKCPHCGGLVTSLNGTVVQASVGGQQWKSVILHCPFCTNILGAQFDPVIIAQDIIASLKRHIDSK